MKKILITGATGFIGSHLVRALVSAGVQKKLCLLVPPGDSLKNLPHKMFDVVWGDIRDKEVVKRATAGVETIYHLAAKTIFEGAKYRDYAQVNVDGTQNLLDSYRDQRIQKFVFFSSIAVYGLPAYVGEIINWNETRPQNPAEPYGESKLEAERRIIKFHYQTGMPYTIIRPTTVYGPRDRQGIFQLYQAVKGHYFFQVGDGQNLMDYVYVGDLVKGAVLAGQSKSRAGDYILGCGKPITSGDICKLVARSIGESIPKFNLPKNIALVLSYPLWWSPLFPKRVKILTTNCFYDSAKAKKELGYNPTTSFAKGAEITGKWLIKNGEL